MFGILKKETRILYFLLGAFFSIMLFCVWYLSVYKIEDIKKHEDERKLTLTMQKLTFTMMNKGFDLLNTNSETVKRGVIDSSNYDSSDYYFLKIEKHQNNYNRSLGIRILFSLRKQGYHTQLINSVLNGYDLTAVNLKRLELANEDFSFVNFSDADLSGTNFNGAIVYLAEFNGADLRGAEFNNADLGDVEFNDADLRGAEFNNADLGDAEFKNALYDSTTTFPEGFDPKAAGMTQTRKRYTAPDFKNQFAK